MTFFGPDLRNGLPIGLGSVAGFGIAPPRFSPASLFTGGVQGAWYDPSDPTTLFSDRAGTTPCGTPGGGSVVPVGLMLDKSQGLVLGSELFSTFTSTGTWTVLGGGAYSISSAAAQTDLSVSYAGTTGKRYVISFTLSGVSGTVFCYPLNSSPTGNLSSGVITLRYEANGFGAFIIRAAAGASATVTNISVRELPGNHAIAANDTTARPELRARVNLLERSEEFDNAYWTSSQGTIAANAGVAPNGTTTADLLTPTSTGTFRQRYRVFAASAISYSLSVYAKASGKTGLMFTDFPGNVAGAQFDLSAGTVTSTASGYTATIQAVGDGWYRCVMTATPTAGATRYAGICVTDNGSTTTGTLDGTNGILIWGAQLTATNEFPANTYQRIVDANTYDAVGFPRYLAANGTSSAMSTPGNVNLSGTDKVTVFVGVRKNDNTNAQIIAETSASSATNNGSFSCVTNVNSVGGSLSAAYGVLVRGTSLAGAGAAGTTAPISNVVDGLFNISAAADASILRVNGAQVATSGATSAGAGNFGTYPLYIGARNTSGLFLNGNIYSLIVVGSAVSAGQISATEQWVAGKVGITI